MIGSLRDRISLQNVARTDDGGGGASELWTTFAAVWAEVAPRRSVDDEAGDRSAHQRRYRIRIRHRDDVTFQTRIVFEGRNLMITSLEAIGDGARWLALECEESES